MCIRTAIEKINRAINAIKGINCLTALHLIMHISHAYHTPTNSVTCLTQWDNIYT